MQWNRKWSPDSAVPFTCTELWASFSLLFWSLWLLHLSSVSSCSCFQWLTSKPTAYDILQMADGQIQWLDVELFLSQTRGESVWWTKSQRNHSRRHLGNVCFCKTTALLKVYISSCCSFMFLHLARVRKRSWFGLKYLVWLPQPQQEISWPRGVNMVCWPMTRTYVNVSVICRNVE